jgi:hypothetical protein
MTDEPAADPMRVLELVQAAEQLAAYLMGETGCETINAMIVLDALATLELTVTPAGPAEVEALQAAYLSTE